MQQEIHLALLLTVSRQLAGNIIDLLDDPLKGPGPVGHTAQAEILLFNGLEQIGNDVDFIDQLLKKVIAEINQRHAQHKQGEELEVNGLLRKKPEQQVSNDSAYGGQAAEQQVTKFK
ncbi:MULTISPECIES: hypothetical protein [Pseudomonas]|uniref:hypothetical protein n=1 Tax=Pseudomonas TaxID=286 RepID=UPI00237BEB01|nr:MULTISPECIES: hypothetical protein [Pseudomonas]